MTRSNDTIEITIEDDGMRYLLIGALWERAAEPLSHCTDEVFRCGYSPADVSKSDPIDAKFAIYTAARADIERLREAAVGDVVELSLSRENLVKLVQDYRGFIAWRDDFWTLSPEDQALQVAMHAASGEFLERLGVVEPVAA
jgi:hypothetical protein